jgi:hypothetical protein
MRNFLALIGLLVVGFGGVGWYCGWYKLHVTRDTGGDLQIQTEVRTNKVAEDSSAFFQKVGQVIGERAAKNDQPASAPGTTPGPVSSPTDTPVEKPVPVADPKPAGQFQGGWITVPLPAQPAQPLQKTN